MNEKELLMKLQNGDKLYFYESEGLAFPGVRPASREDFTHYIYFDKKWELFYEYSRKDKKVAWVDALRVKRVFDMMTNEQEKVERLFQSKIYSIEKSEKNSRVARRESRK